MRTFTQNTAMAKISMDTTINDMCCIMSSPWFAEAHVDICRQQRVRIEPIILPKRKMPFVESACNLTHENLILTCRFLAKHNIYDCALTIDGSPTPHWSCTKEDMEKQLGRILTDLEITCLSLGRNFGPTPSVSEEEFPILQEYLTKDCCSSDWYTWTGLANRLAKYDREEGL